MAPSHPALETLLSPDDFRLYRRNIASLEERVLGSPWGRGVSGPILTAIRSVPRHLFVHPSHRALAYADLALPTAGGMTTSAPSVVAYMIHLACIGHGHRVLEVGTGTGYQAAILARLGARVCTIECSLTLARAAARVLDELGYRSGPGRVRIFHGNGRNGYPAGAPYDAILVAAAAPDTDHLDALTRQLAPHGLLVAPVGPGHTQELVVLSRGTRGLGARTAPGITVDFVRLVETGERS